MFFFVLVAPIKIILKNEKLIPFSNEGPVCFLFFVFFVFFCQYFFSHSENKGFFMGKKKM